MLEPPTTGFLVALVRKKFWVAGPDVRLYLGIPRSRRLGLTTFDDIDIETDDAERIPVGDDWHWLAWLPKREHAFLWADLGVCETHAMAMKRQGYAEVVIEYAAHPGLIPKEWSL